LLAQGLCDDAADAPHVQLLVVLLSVEDDLRGTLPACDHLLGHKIVLLRRVPTPAQAKVADLEIALFIEQQISRLQVSVDDVATV